MSARERLDLAPALVLLARIGALCFELVSLLSRCKLELFLDGRHEASLVSPPVGLDGIQLLVHHLKEARNRESVLNLSHELKLYL